jgi:hypothetical protein
LSGSWPGNNPAARIGLANGVQKLEQHKRETHNDMEHRTQAGH